MTAWVAALVLAGALGLGCSTTADDDRAGRDRTSGPNDHEGGNEDPEAHNDGGGSGGPEAPHRTDGQIRRVTVTDRAQTGPDGQPTRDAPFDYDGWGLVEDQVFAGLAEVMAARGIKAVRIPSLLLQSESELRAGVAEGQKPWLEQSIVRGAAANHIRDTARSLSRRAAMLVNNPPVIGDIVVGGTMRDELTRMIIDSMSDDFDPAAQQALGVFQSADAVLVGALTASFEPIRQTGIVTQYSWWVRGTYEFEARLIRTETGTRIWTGSASWERWFVVTGY